MPEPSLRKADACEFVARKFQTATQQMNNRKVLIDWSAMPCAGQYAPLANMVETSPDERARL